MDTDEHEKLKRKVEDRCAIRMQSATTIAQADAARMDLKFELNRLERRFIEASK